VCWLPCPAHRFDRFPPQVVCSLCGTMGVYVFVRLVQQKPPCLWLGCSVFWQLSVDTYSFLHSTWPASLKVSSVTRLTTPVRREPPDMCRRLPRKRQHPSQKNHSTPFLESLSFDTRGHQPRAGRLSVSANPACCPSALCLPPLRIQCTHKTMD
jgi:hypothetical protein